MNLTAGTAEKVAAEAERLLAAGVRTRKIARRVAYGAVTGRPHPPGNYRLRVVPCGTEEGYQQHRAAGVIPSCPPCRAAHARHNTRGAA